MEKYIALLRGINVSGKRKIKMADLRDLLALEGFENAQTYIQSGNVVFSAKGQTVRKLERQISTLIEKQYGFDVPVIVIEASQIKEIMTVNPFLAESAKNLLTLYVAFLSDEPASETIKNIPPGQFLPDRFYIKGKHVFLCYATQYSNSKLNNNFLEKKLKVTATIRNWKTIKALAAMAGA